MFFEMKKNENFLNEKLFFAFKIVRDGVQCTLTPLACAWLNVCDAHVFSPLVNASDYHCN